MTDTPDYAKILRQGDLEDVLTSILEATFDSQSPVTHEGEDGKGYSLVVDKTSGGNIRATLYRHDAEQWWDGAEVAQVRLDYTVKQVQP